jgi:hypothetical protein
MVGAVGGAALWLVWLWLRDGLGIMELFVLTVPFLLIGGGLRFLAWALEGFLRPSVEHK